MTLSCIFCKTRCSTFLKHLKKYHRIKISPFPKTEIQASKYFRSIL